MNDVWTSVGALNPSDVILAPAGNQQFPGLVAATPVITWAQIVPVVTWGTG
jgi:hypothetical protein